MTTMREFLLQHKDDTVYVTADEEAIDVSAILDEGGDLDESFDRTWLDRTVETFDSRPCVIEYAQCYDDHGQLHTYYVERPATVEELELAAEYGDEEEAP